MSNEHDRDMCYGRIFDWEYYKKNTGGIVSGYHRVVVGDIQLSHAFKVPKEDYPPIVISAPFMFEPTLGYKPNIEDAKIELHFETKTSDEYNQQNRDMMTWFDIDRLRTDLELDILVLAAKYDHIFKELNTKLESIRESLSRQ